MAKVTLLNIKGGDKMERALNELAKNLKRAHAVRVGFLEGAKYPDGTSVALVAAVNDFGAPKAGIPPRPFFRNMVADKSKTWPKAIELNLKNTGYDAARTMALVGEGIKGQLQQAIVDFEGASLKPATVAKKGFEKQLVDTGHMLNSVDYEVK